MSSSPLTLISWNIYRNARPEQIERSLSKLIRAHVPDVLLIQEAPVYETERFSDLALLSDYSSFYAPVHEILQPSSRFRFVSTGQLTLLKWEPITSEVHPLPPVSGALRPPSEGATVGRLALYTRIAFSGKQMGIYNVHLENRSMPAGRLAQVTHLLDAIVPSQGDDVVVIGGDLNTFFPAFLESSLACFQERGFTNVFADERRWLPRLDYIFVRGAEAWALPVSGRGSDHQPILAQISPSDS